jgi:predicted DNA-binding protein
MRDSPGRKHFLLRLPHDLFERTKSYADKENFSITRYINRAIEAYVEATDEVDEYLAESDDKESSPPQSNPAWWM